MTELSSSDLPCYRYGKGLYQDTENIEDSVCHCIKQCSGPRFPFILYRALVTTQACRFIACVRLK